MKTTRILLTIVTALFIISCNKDDITNELETQAITEEEAVEIVETSLAAESAGLSETTYTYAKVYEEETVQNVTCDEDVTDNYEVYRKGTVAEADYDFDWTYKINCNMLSIPQSATLTAESAGVYSSQRIESDDSSTLTATVTGLQPSSDDIVYAGEFTRNGTQKITTNKNSKSLTTKFTSSFESITVSKSSYSITSGKGSFSLSGTLSDETFTYNGSLVFNSDNTATLTINGSEYTIDLK